MTQFPVAVPAATLCGADKPCCQFVVTSSVVEPGRRKRISKNVLLKRMKPDGTNRQTLIRTCGATVSRTVFRPRHFSHQRVAWRKMGHRLEGREWPRHHCSVARRRIATLPLFLRRRTDFSGFTARELVSRRPYDDRERENRRDRWRWRGHTSTGAWRVIAIVGKANGTIGRRSSSPAGCATGA